MKNIKFLSVIMLQLFFFQAMAQTDGVVLRDGRSVSSQPATVAPQVEGKKQNTNIYDANFSDQDVPDQRVQNNAAQADWVFPDDLDVMADEMSVNASSKEVAERINRMEEQLKTLIQFNEQLRLENRTIKKSLDNCCNANAGLTSADAYILQNAPNPFNNSTAINYFVPNDVQNARLEISNVKGDLIKSYDIKEGGFGAVQLDGKSLMTGTYVYSLHIGGEFVDSKVMIITQ